MADVACRPSSSGPRPSPRPRSVSEAEARELPMTSRRHVSDSGALKVPTATVKLDTKVGGPKGVPSIIAGRKPTVKAPPTQSKVSSVRPRANTLPGTKQAAAKKVTTAVNPPRVAMLATRPKSASSTTSSEEQVVTPKSARPVVGKKDETAFERKAKQNIAAANPAPKADPARANPKASNITNGKTPLALQTKAREIARLQRLLDAAEKRSKLGDINSMEFYDMGKQLGEGAFAQVKLASHKMLGEKVAVKVFDRRILHNEPMKRRLNHEIDIMKRLDHDNIVKIYETAQNLQRFFIVMEYCSMGTLAEFVKSKGEGSERKLTEDEARRVFRQVVEAVDFCHKHQVIHRDIKMENILLDTNMNVRIADFGLSTKVPNSKYLSGYCGTPNYVAPEICLGGRYRGETADWWSVGVLLYRLVCGCFPFYGSDQYELKKAIMKGKYAFPKELSNSVKNLISSLMKNKPEDRLTPDEIRCHPWLQGGDLSPTRSMDSEDHILDPEILRHVASLGFDANFVVKSVAEKSHNAASAFYNLAVVKKKRTGSLNTLPEVELTPRGVTPADQAAAAVEAALQATDLPA